MEGLTPPPHSELVREVYDFIVKYSHYSIKRSGGMGLDVEVAPDMDKICRRAEKYDIEIDRYEDYIEYFLSKKSEQERKKD